MLVQIPKVFFEKTIEAGLAQGKSELLNLIILNTWYKGCNSIKKDVILKNFSKSNEVTHFELYLAELHEHGFIDITKDRIHIQSPDTYLTKKELSDRDKIDIFNSILEQWNSQDILITHIARTVSRHKSEIVGMAVSAGNNNGVEGAKLINDAIYNYSVVLGGDDYYFTHSWTLLEFLRRGLDKFKSESKPLTNFLKFQKKVIVTRTDSEYPEFE